MSPQGTAPSRPSFTPATVTVVDPAGNGAKAVSRFAANQGFFDRLGLTADVQSVTGVDKMIPSVLTGGIDLGIFAGMGAVLAAIEGGATLKIVAGSRIKPDYLVTTGHPEIRTLADLAGRSVGTSSIGALPHAVLLAMLYKHNVDPNSIEFVNIGAGPDRFLAAASRKVDAAVTQASTIPSMAEAGLTYLGESWKELPSFVSSIIFTSDRAIAERRDVLIRALATYALGMRAMREPSSKEPYTQAFVEIGGTAADGEFDWTWNYDHAAFAYDLVLTDEQLTYMQELGVQVGQLGEVMPNRQVADMSLAQEAIELLSSL